MGLLFFPPTSIGFQSKLFSFLYLGILFSDIDNIRYTSGNVRGNYPVYIAIEMFEVPNPVSLVNQA